MASEKKPLTKTKSAAANLLRLSQEDPSPSARDAVPQDSRLDAMQAQMTMMAKSLHDLHQFMQPPLDRTAQSAPDLPAPRDTDGDAMAAQLEAFSSEEAPDLPRKLKRQTQLDKDAAAGQGVPPVLLQALKGLMDASSSKVSPPHPPPQMLAKRS